MCPSRTATDGGRPLRAARAGLLALLLALPALCLGAAADFHGGRASGDVRYVAGWAVETSDNAALPFIIVDKRESRVYVFDAQGVLQGAAPALVGLAAGDESVPGIGTRKMSTIRPDERTTPAGRFAATLDRSLHGDEILWVDYDAAVALHRVITTVPGERRLQRLASSTAADRRITYGCINVPVKFFENVVLPALRGGRGVVYVLPETKSAREVFGSSGAAPATRKEVP